MNILIAANSDIGLYKFRKELLEELVKNHKVFVALPKGKFYQEIVNIGCTFIETDYDRHGVNPFKELQLISLFNKILKNIKPDIVFTYTIKPNVYAGMACASQNIPYVANITGLGTSIENGGIMQKITLSLYKIGLRKAKKVFFQNTENRDFMLNKNIIKSPYDMLPGSGVNLEQYNVTEYPNGDTIDFMFISRLMKEKGTDQYLEAAEYIRKKYPQTRFHVCGSCEKEYEGNLEKLQKDGTIIYHGLVSDIASMHKISGCTIHPTYYPEGLSNVLLESCACGRPIITTNRSGCREVVDNGVNGFVVKERDSKDLIEKIEQFLSLSYDEKKNMGLAGRKKVEKEFDRKIVTAKYLEELN